MAGILVMGVALGLQEGGKKIKEKRDERKAKKAALVGFDFICSPEIIPILSTGSSDA